MHQKRKLFLAKVRHPKFGAVGMLRDACADDTPGTAGASASSGAPPHLPVLDRRWEPSMGHGALLSRTGLGDEVLGVKADQQVVSTRTDGGLARVASIVLFLHRFHKRTENREESKASK